MKAIAPASWLLSCSAWNGERSFPTQFRRRQATPCKPEKAMSYSFTLRKTPHTSDERPGKRSVLVTGATGNIGLPFARHGHEKYDLKLMVRETSDEKIVAELKGLGQIVTTDMADLPALKEVL